MTIQFVSCHCHFQKFQIFCKKFQLYFLGYKENIFQPQEEGCCERPAGCQLPDRVVGNGTNAVTFRRFIKLGTTSIFGDYEYACGDGNGTAVVTITGRLLVTNINARLFPARLASCHILICSMLHFEV